jgi:putative transposase
MRYPDWSALGFSESVCWILVPLDFEGEGGMGRCGYPPEFRRKVLDLVAAGWKVAGIARDLGISDQTIYSWRWQDRIDRGVEAGLTSGEKAELAAAKRRIAQLEAELVVHRRATERLKKEAVRPQARYAAIAVIAVIAEEGLPV